MDDHKRRAVNAVRCGTISSSQPAATSEIVKRHWSWVMSDLLQSRL